MEGRVIAKKPIIHFTTSAGKKDKLFSFVIADESGEINVVVVGPACEARFETISIGKCYKLSAFRQKLCNPQFRVADHDIELSLTQVRP